MVFDKLNERGQIIRPIRNYSIVLVTQMYGGHIFDGTVLQKQ